MVLEGLAAVMQAGLDGENTNRVLALRSIFSTATLPGLESLMNTAMATDEPWIGLNILRRSIHSSYSKYNFLPAAPVYVETALTKANRLRALANKELSMKTTYSNAWVEAMERYREAASLYATEAIHRDASECYKSAADCALFVHQPVTAAEFFILAAEQSYSGKEIETSIWLFDQAIEVYKELNRGVHIARTHRRIADILISCEQVNEETIRRYQLAADGFMKDKTLRGLCLFQVGTMLCVIHKYSQAIPVFEELATTKSSKVGMYFHAMLAALADVVPGNRLPGIERATAMFSKYQDEEAGFQIGQEHYVVSTLLQAWKTQDVPLAEKALQREMLLSSGWTETMQRRIYDNIQLHVQLIHT